MGIIVDKINKAFDNYHQERNLEISWHAGIRSKDD